MKAAVVDADLLSATKDSIAILDFEQGDGARNWLSGKNKNLADQLSHAMESGDFRFKDGQVMLLYGRGNFSCDRVIFAGLGKKQDFKHNKIRTAVSSIVNAVRLMGVKELAFCVDSSYSLSEQALFCRSVIEAVFLSHHKYEVHKTEKELTYLNSIILSAPGRQKDLAPVVQSASVVCNNVLLARDLINTGASDKPPKMIAEYVQKKAGKNIKVSALFKKELQRMGAGGILSVNRGSTNEPCLLVMEYKPEGYKPGEYNPGEYNPKMKGTGKKEIPGKKGMPTVALVGKGIVFDSGGLDIKPPSGMETMKGDMTGAASVIHAILAAAALNIPVHIVAISALTDNMVGPDSYKPGDFVKTMSGKTVEILNTDAEGRMVLADALHYAKSFKPDYIIDIATLTGACWIALGGEAAGLFCNDASFSDQLVKAGEETHERLWPLPMFDEYAELMKSDFADLKNVVSNSPSGGGAITAAKFLENWVDKKQKWAHLDIAGVDWMEVEKDFRPRGATGFGVRLLVRFLADLAIGKGSLKSIL